MLLGPRSQRSFCSRLVVLLGSVACGGRTTSSMDVFGGLSFVWYLLRAPRPARAAFFLVTWFCKAYGIGGQSDGSMRTVEKYVRHS
jgi:hypothetical protein